MLQPEARAGKDKKLSILQSKEFQEIFLEFFFLLKKRGILLGYKQFQRGDCCNFWVKLCTECINIRTNKGNIQ